MWIVRLAPSLGQVVFLLLATTQIYKNGDYEPHCTFHSAQYASTGSAARVSPAAIRIHSLKNFDSELQLINTGLVQSPVSFSGQGEKLLERNKCPGHNLRQYDIYIHTIARTTFIGMPSCLHLDRYKLLSMHVHVLLANFMNDQNIQ